MNFFPEKENAKCKKHYKALCKDKITIVDMIFKIKVIELCRLIQSSHNWDMVATSSHDPEKVIFNFSSHELISSEEHLLSKGLCIVIPPTKIE